VLELAGEEEDLFASLVMSASKNIEADVIEETVTSEVSSDADDNSSLGDVDVVVEAMPSKASKTSKTSKPKAEKMSPEEKAALVEQKKLEAEQKKLALVEQKKLEAEQKKVEAEQKKLLLAEQKKVEAEQKKLALAEQKKQEAEQKKAVTEKKAPEKKAKKTKVDDDDRPSPAFIDPPVAEEADVVKKIMFEGKKYLKSKNTGIIYNMEQDVIGKWNEEKNRIDFNVADEESEDEYDEDM
jgi:colicin import membrane protein